MIKKNMSSANKLNLIPKDLLVNSGVQKIISVFKKASVFAGIFSSSSAILFSFYYFFVYTNLRKTENDNSAIKNSIVSMEEDEKKLFFAKDRLSKSLKIKSSKNIQKSLNSYKFIQGYLLADKNFEILGVEILADGFELSSKSENLSSCNNFINFLEENKDNFKEILISDFISGTQGYTLNIKFTLNQT